MTKFVAEALATEGVVTAIAYRFRIHLIYARKHPHEGNLYQPSDETKRNQMTTTKKLLSRYLSFECKSLRSSDRRIQHEIITKHSSPVLCGELLLTNLPSIVEGALTHRCRRKYDLPLSKPLPDMSPHLTEVRSNKVNNSVLKFLCHPYHVPQAHGP